jgi:hypothetical protein
MRDARLARVDLPRVEVENGRATIAAIDPRHRPARKAVRQHPEEATAPGRHPAPAKFHSGHRQLEQVGVGERPEGEARRFGPAIMIVPDRRDAGRISIAFLGQHAVRPGRARIDGEARRAVADRAETAGILDGGAGAAQIGAELVGRESENTLVVPAMAGDFVPASTMRRMSAG